MSSIITNRSALQALQAVNAAGRDLTTTQARVSTGLKVGGVKDNAAIFGIAQGMRAEIGGWAAAAQSLSRARSALDVTEAALSATNDILLRMSELASAYADQSLSSDSRSLIRADIEALSRQLDDQARLAEFDGLNFISGVGISATTYARALYSLPASTDTPQSFLTPMATGAAASISRRLMTINSYSAPYSPLTPGSFTQVSHLAEVAQGTSPPRTDRNIVPAGGTLVVDRTSDITAPAYASAGRVDIWLDAFTEPNALEIWHGGQRVAATGQPYIAGAPNVGVAAPVTGQTMLSFDYDPSDGRTFEIRSSGAGGWAFEMNGESGPLTGPVGAPSSHLVTLTSTASASLPAVNLRPETSGTSPPSMGYRSVTVNGGTNPGRVDMLFDAFETPDLVEVFQNGVRVAATGLPYISGGAAVGSASAVSGQHVLSFDYDPAAGTALEFRFNGGNLHPGAGWAVGGLELNPLGSPVIAGSFPATTIQQVETSTFRESAASLGTDPTALDPETEATGSISQTYTINGGDKSGRVDLWVDAYDDADVVEVWHAGVRVAASGQGYVHGGGAVGPGASQPNDIFLSFDYDHTLGQPLEFRFNEGLSGVGAWTVGGLVLQDSSAPMPSGDALITPVPGEVFPDITFIQTGRGDPIGIESRNMTAAGLRLTGIDWNDPADLIERVDQAIARAIEAATHFGTQANLFDALLNQNTSLRDTLQTGVGNLVDADLAKESAKLQAQQIRQQLATQTLGIANREPRWLMSLFRGYE